MKRGSSLFRPVETAIVANGDFPRKGSFARDALARAKRVVCCDGAADVFRRIMKREPDAVVGDCDSLKGRFANVVCDPGQDDNDLAKAARHCRKSGWKDPVVFGATGKRPDHAIGNIFRALDEGLAIYTDRGCFIPVEGRAAIRAEKGTPVSVFAPDPSTKMTSKGLEWPLDGIAFPNLYCATLNRTTSAKIELYSSRRVYVYFGA